MKINLKKESFAVDILTISIGTIISQVIPFILYPFLARIYAPEDFGVLAILAAFVPILAIIYSGMYEGGILVTESKNEAASLFLFILYRSSVIFCISIFLYFILRHFGYLFADDVHDLINLFYVVPISAFTLVIINCYNEWCVTYKYFVNLSVNKMFFTSSVGLSKLFLGLSKCFDNGLIFGDLLGKVFTAKYSAFAVLKKDSIFFYQVKYEKFNILRKKFRKFPKYLLPDQLVNNLSGSIHVFLIGFFFGNEDVGYLAMAASLLTVPVTVITAAVKDVFRERANREFKLSGNCRPLIMSILAPITIVSLIFFIPLYFVLPQAFTLALGEQWTKSGIFAQILVPMYVTNFVSMSLGGILVIADKMNISFYWQIFNLCLTTLAIFIGFYYFKDIKATLIAYTIAKSSAYVLFIIISYYFAKNENEIVSE